MVLSPGDCNCCGVLGKVVFLAALHDGVVFLACNFCSSASRASEYEDHWLTDGSHPISEFAPRGFRPASEREVASQGYDLSRVLRLDDEEFELFS
jgi:hypothetical protein